MINADRDVLVLAKPQENKAIITVISGKAQDIVKKFCNSDILEITGEKVNSFLALLKENNMSFRFKLAE